MNPFLHDTVAQPLSAVAPAARRDGRHLRRPAVGRSSRLRLSRILGAAGLAALTWAGTAGALDLNTATLDQLQGIRGIGPKTARIILDERTRGGRYLSFADLSDRVRGIGPRRAQALQAAGLTIDGGGMRLSGQGAEARKAADGQRVATPAGGTAPPKR